MLALTQIHHIAVICTDYPVSKKFYTEILGLTIEAEHFRKERNSFKLDLRLNDRYVIELFSFPDSPSRPSHPEAAGLRHLAFSVENLDHALATLQSQHIEVEPVRVDPYTGKRFTFFKDPDNLPLELYESR